MLRVPRMARLIGSASLILFAWPLMISSESVIFRALAVAYCLDLFLKLADYGRQIQFAPRQRSFAELCYLLPPMPLFLAVIEEKLRLTRWDTSPANLLRIVAGAMGVAASVGMVLYLNQLPLIREHFLLDHILKVALFLVCVEAGSRLMQGLERLAGFDTTPLVRNVFLSVTVAEFWLRWNNRVQRWLYLNIFRPIGKPLGRAGGLFLVFAFSGLIHEIGFGVATGHWDGYQLAFFSMQTPLVLFSDYTSRAMRRHKWVVQVPMYLLTLIWMTATSMLFLRGVDRVFPFVYASEPWLP